MPHGPDYIERHRRHKKLLIDINEHQTNSVNREIISAELLDTVAASNGILLRHANQDPTLNGEVNFYIKKLAKLTEKKSDFERKELIK